MLSTLFAVSWEPGLRGIVVVLISVVVLIGGTYLVVGTNLGARLGFLVVIAAFFGWMMTMGAIWWTYGIGLIGPAPFWFCNAPGQKTESPAVCDPDGLQRTMGHPTSSRQPRCGCLGQRASISHGPVCCFPASRRSGWPGCVKC